jgi:hypothetical protein
LAFSGVGLKCLYPLSLFFAQDLLTMTDPQTVLRHLYDVAVQRALPLHNTAAHLPTPPDPAKGRTLVLGADAGSGLPGMAVTTYGGFRKDEDW